MSNRKFWNLIELYVSNRGSNTQEDIMLFDHGKIVSDTKELAETFNNIYINIVERNCGRKPKDCSLDFPSDDMHTIVQHILDTYQDHLSIIAIKTKNNLTETPTFRFREVSVQEVNKLLNSLDEHKSTGEDQLALKLIKLAANVLNVPISKAINASLLEGKFLDRAKAAAVTPLYKGDDRAQAKNYRPVSVLNTISKIYEKAIKQQIIPFTEKVLSIYLSAYRKHHSTQHVLIRLLEEWRSNLDNDLVVGALLIDLSKAFDSIPHDLLVAKLGAYGFSEDSIAYLYSYLKGRKQAVRIKNVYSTYQTILAGVPQGSILGPILFNIFISDLTLFIQKAEIHNFADDNTLSAHACNIPNLLTLLEEESTIAVDWLDSNDMLANPEKFQALLLTKTKANTAGHTLCIRGKEILSENCVELLGIKIDNKLCFDEHISDICRRAAAQLNALIRLKSNLNFTTKKVLVESYIYANFNYCPLVWNFSSGHSSSKIEQNSRASSSFCL